MKTSWEVAKELTKQTEIPNMSIINEETVIGDSMEIVSMLNSFFVKQPKKLFFIFLIKMKLLAFIQILVVTILFFALQTKMNYLDY